jgi:Holliday junction resolvasome RuvABC endonuclease subunit
MNENDRTVIANFEEKLHRLVFEYKQNVELNKKLTAMVQQKENALKELEFRCVALEKNYNNLKQAKILSLSDNAVDETKERISKLVREIDRCIESLKK